MTRTANYAIATAALVAVVAAATYGPNVFSGESERDKRLAALRQVALPGDGLPLFGALLQEIPDVVAQVPCACCGNSLKWCYSGGCPPT